METEKYRALLKRLHPKQILNTTLSIPLYLIQYQYTTIRGNIRRGEKYYFSTNGDHENWDLEVEMKLKDWINDENFWKPYRAVSNVKILDIVRVAYANFNL